MTAYPLSSPRVLKAASRLSHTRRRAVSAFAALLALSTLALLHHARTLLSMRASQRASSERVAICFAGSARTFRHAPTHEHILRRVVEPLRREHPVDVFFLLGLDDAVVKRGKHLARKNDTATLDAVASFQPTSVRLLSASDNLPPSRIVKFEDAREFDAFRPPAACTHLAANASCRVPDALHRSKQCLHMIEQHERQHAMRFSWVYRLRPDIILLNDTLLPRQLRRDTVYSNQGRPNVTTRMGLWWRQTHGQAAMHGAIADQMAFGHRDVTDIALRAVDATDDCELFGAPGRIGPEEILRFWLMKHGVRYRAVPFDWAIVREEIGPECQRLFWQNGVGANWTRSMQDCIRWGVRYRHLFPQFRVHKISKWIERGRLPEDIVTW